MLAFLNKHYFDFLTVIYAHHSIVSAKQCIALELICIYSVKLVQDWPLGLTSSDEIF